MAILDRKDLTNVQVVLLALLKQGGEQQDVDTEDVAVCAHDIAPGRFVWRKYPEHISLEVVRIALKDAKKLDLVAGGTRKGWHLTKSGADWAIDHQESIRSGARPTQRVDPEVSRRHELEKHRLPELQAWKKFSAGEEVGKREANAVFRLTDYVDSHRRSLMVERMRSLMGRDEVFGRFIETMARIVTAPEKETGEHNE